MNFDLDLDPQTDGLVERFNQTLKHMLRKVVDVDGKNWDQLLPRVLFSIREVHKFHRIHRSKCCADGGPGACWMWPRKPGSSSHPQQRSVVEHVERMHHRMTQVWPLVREHMQQAQAQQAQVYNRGAQVREFEPGKKVMVLVPTNGCNF